MTFRSAQSEIEECLIALLEKRKRRRDRFKEAGREIEIAQTEKKVEVMDHLEECYKKIGTWFLGGGQS